MFPQILAAIVDLGQRDLRRVDQSHVGGAHVAIRSSIFAMAETRNIAPDDLGHPRRRAQMRTCDRIRGFSSSAMASTSQHSHFRCKNAGGFRRSYAGLRTVCRKR